jgi:hypothetical protein
MNSGFSYLTQTQENKWVFYAAGQSWQVWEKPDGCNFIHIVVIGAGGGGGGGYQRVAANPGGGGGGGVSGGIAITTIPAYTIPDKLYIQVGVGGAGGANLAGGAAGGSTYIGLVPDSTITSANLLILAISSFSGGAAGSSTGGISGMTSTPTTPFTGWSKNLLVSSVAGSAGTTPSTDLTQTRLVGGGAGGAYAAGTFQVVGRSVTSSYKQPSAVTYSVGAAIGANGARAGSGPNLVSPQSQFFGGAGGAAQTSGNSSNGGDGGIGCGGGGAGVGVNGTLTGGKGGNGLVIITCW